MEIIHTRSRPNCALLRLDGAAAMGGGMDGWGMTEPKIYTIKLSDLLDDPANANRGTERGQYMLDASIAQVGAGRGIVIDREGRIIAGNKTRQALMDAGIDEAVVVETDGRQLVITQRADMDLADNDPNNPARKYAYYDNRTSEVSLDWDPERILADVQSGFDFGAMFQDAELAELLGGLLDDEEPKETAPQIDRAGELQKEWGTEPGQLWQLGRHRLICGDCTDRAVVEAVMRGEKADLGVTSPPYAVGKEYELNISFDDHLNLLRGMADRALETIRPGGFLFINFGEIAPQSHSKPLTGSNRQCLYLISKDYWEIFHIERRMDLYAQRIWYKPFNRLQQPFWTYHTSIPHHQEWEHIWTWRLPGGNGDYVYNWDISSRAVWDTRNEATDDKPLTRHVAAFPVGIPERAIKAHSSEGSIVWEPFSGSGTTLIACENLNRQCRAVEISPGYVAVTLQRFLDHTGIQPELIS